MSHLELFVPGVPKTKGSFRLLKNPKTGKNFPANNPDVDDWEAAIKAFAFKEWNRPLISGALRLTCQFTLQRPLKHYRTVNGLRELRSDAPVWAAMRKMDGDKMLRAVWDALTGVVYEDDGLIVAWPGWKKYGDHPGVRIVVEEL